MNVVMCASEVFPFAKTGGLADVCGSLPIALEKIGVDVSVFLPKYKTIFESGFEIKNIRDGLFHTVLGDNVDVYFVENDEYYDRDGLYGDSSGDFSDNLERYKYFCLKVLDLIKKMDMKVDIVHCNDWQTALIPVYLKEKYVDDMFYSSIKTVMTIHNLAYQGLFGAEDYPKLGLKDDLQNHLEFEFWGRVNLLKAGIVYSDIVTTVSRQYAEEILTENFGCGLENVLLSRKDDIVGILNGLDHDIWEPKEDTYVLRKFSSDNYEDALFENKKALQSRVGFVARNDVPVFGFVGRLSHQKGVDLIIDSMEDIVSNDIQVIIQGIGEEGYQKQLVDLSRKYPDKLAVCFEFDERLAHQIYAGSDIFLMPSNFEPCGLSQMISFRYGTVPIVFNTGGLADTVLDHSFDNDVGNGFVFKEYTKESFVAAINRAINLYNDSDQFLSLVNEAFRTEFPWDKSAQEYRKIYKCLLLE